MSTSTSPKPPTTLHLPIPQALQSANPTSPSNNTTPSPSSTVSVTSHQRQTSNSKSQKDVKVTNVPQLYTEPDWIEPPSDRANPVSPVTHKFKHSDYQRLRGETEVEVRHMHDKNAPAIKVNLSNDDLQFNLQPFYLGSPENYFLYLNAANSEWYRQKVENPILTAWVLIKNTSFTLNTLNNIGYVKRRLVEEALRQHIQIQLMNPKKFDLSIQNQQRRQGTVVYSGQELQLPDCVIPRLGANIDYFGLAVLRHLESLSVPIFNPLSAIEISRDKLYTHQVLASSHIPVPATILSRFPFDYNYIEASFGHYPLIVKLASGSRGEAVWKVDSREELEKLCESIDHTRPIIVQEFLQSTRGKDIRCLVVGDRVVAACLRQASNSFKSNFHSGGTVSPIHIGEELAKLVVATSQLCGLHFSGVDVLLDEDAYKICEVNSSPGFEGVEKASQVNCGKAMIDYVREEMQKRKLQQALSANEPMKQYIPRVYPIQADHELAYQEALKKRQQKTSSPQLPQPLQQQPAQLVAQS